MKEYLSCPKCDVIFKNYSWTEYAMLQSGVCYNCNEPLPNEMREKFPKIPMQEKPTLSTEEQMLECLKTIKNCAVAIVWFFIVIPIAGFLIYQVLYH